MTQDRPKTAPRRFSRAAFFDLDFIIDFGPSWARFWLHLGSHLGTLFDTETAASAGLKASKTTHHHINAREGGELHYWEALGALLGGSWGLLGASWAVLGGSWALLGAS